MLVKCDRCKVPFVDEASLRLSLSQDELRHIAGHILRSWRFWLPLSLGLVAAAWLALQLVDYATERKAQDVIDNISANVSNRLDQADETMASTIAARFEEPRIEALMREVATDRASTLMTEQISPEIVRFKTDLAAQLREVSAMVARTQSMEEESRNHRDEIDRIRQSMQASLKEVDARLVAASAAQQELTEIAAFQLLAVKAMGDDATAWDTLRARSSDVSDPFHTEAQALWTSIQHPFSGPTLSSYSTLDSKIASVAQKLPLAELDAFATRATPLSHAHLVEMTWGRTDLSRFEKLSFLAYILEHSPSLNGRAAAGKHFAAEAGRWFGHLRTDEWLSWWKDNRGRIKADCDKKDAEQDESTVPSRAAPSASSDVR